MIKWNSKLGVVSGVTSSKLESQESEITFQFPSDSSYDPLTIIFQWKPDSLNGSRSRRINNHNAYSCIFWITIGFVLYFSLWLQQTGLSLKIISKGVFSENRTLFTGSWHFSCWNPVYGSTCTLTNNWQARKSHHCQLSVACFPCLLIRQKNKCAAWNIPHLIIRLIYLKFVLNLPKLQLHNPPIPNSTNFSFSSVSISAVFKWAVSHNLGKITYLIIKQITKEGTF